MKSAGLHLHPVPQDLPAVKVATDLSNLFVILRRVTTRWNASARVVAVHQSEAEALADIKTFREFDAVGAYGIFVPHPEPPGGVQ